MSDYKWLQFFADGGAPAGGDGAAEGVSAGDPGPSLEDLGVPADKAERYRKRRGNRPQPTPKQEAAPAAEPEQQAAQPAATQPQSWDDFMKIPENKQRLQQTIQGRVSKMAQARDERTTALDPMFAMLGEKYSIARGDDGSWDEAALVKAFMDDKSNFTDRAIRDGTDEEVAQKMALLEYQEQARKAQEAKQARDLELQKKFMAVRQQAEELRQGMVPDFDIDREIQNPDFLRLVVDMGMPVKQAFMALHGEDMMQQQAAAVAQRVRADTAAAVRSGSLRPRENGSAGTAAVNTTPDLHKMNPAERRAYIMQKYPPRE